MASFSHSARPAGVVRLNAAVLCADVVGYSRLVRIDEAGSSARLESLWGEVIAPAISAHEPRIVKTAQDFTLAAFDRAVGAVAAAVEMQKGVTRREAMTPPDLRISIRVGIYAGDVIIDGEETGGDTWSLASRLAMMAPPGGIYLLEDCWQQAHDKVDVEFQDLGKHRLVSNERFPLRRIYAVSM